MGLRTHLGLIGYSLLALGVALALFFQNQNAGKIEVVAIETHSSLCAFKNDLKGRYDRQQEYINDVREGKRKIIEGITIAELQRSLDAQKSTFDALSLLSCA